MIPGQNLLGAALRLISPQTIMLRAFVSRSENETGDTVAVYADPLPFSGSMQPVEKKLYQQLGLDFSRNYSTLYVFGNISPIARDRDGDLVEFNGKTWLCESDRDWSGVGEYRKILCVQVQDE